MIILGYYNGKIGNIEDMTIPMNDRVCYFGDGVYDATYSANYNIFTIDEHIDRFYNSAALLKIKIPHSKEEMKEILRDMVKRSESGDNFVYWQVTRGTGVRNHIFPTDGSPANVWVTIKPCPIQDTYQKIKCISMEDTRFFHCNIKTLNLIPSVMAAEKAAEMGCQETIFHRGDRVTECAHSNVSTIQDGVFVTAPTDNLHPPRHSQSSSYQAVQGSRHPGRRKTLYHDRSDECRRGHSIQLRLALLAGRVRGRQKGRRQAAGYAQIHSGRRAQRVPYGHRVEVRQDYGSGRTDSPESRAVA